MSSLRDATADAPAPVRAVAQALAGYIDRLGTVWVEGQIAQVSRRPTLNTVFLTLRDTVADLSLSVTCARHVFDGMNPPLVEGASVVINAKPHFYPGRGSLSLQAREIRMVGLGELLARLERRRQLLAAEGLFATELKRPLPFLPQLIGLVTAPGSDAERDVLENARRRWPAARFRVAPARMQGVHCAREVMEALQVLERDQAVDVVVVARGGGSVEDLLPFSDEAVVRAVHAMHTPVVSAIGHEADQPLLDLVADHRASTPTDAARSIVPDFAEELHRLDVGRTRLRQALRGWLDREQHQLTMVRTRPAMADPRHLLDARDDEVQQLRDRARRTLRHRLDRAGDDVHHAAARVAALSPLATLQRGYAVLQGPEGHVVTSIAEVEAGASVSVRVADGRIAATVDALTALTPVVSDPKESDD